MDKELNEEKDAQVPKWQGLGTNSQALRHFQSTGLCYISRLHGNWVKRFMLAWAPIPELTDQIVRYGNVRCAVWTAVERRERVCLDTLPSV